MQDVCLPFALEAQGLVDMFSSFCLLLSRYALALSCVTFVSCRVTVLLCPCLLLILALAAALALAHSSIPRPPRPSLFRRKKLVVLNGLAQQRC